MVFVTIVERERRLTRLGFLPQAGQGLRPVTFALQFQQTLRFIAFSSWLQSKKLGKLIRNQISGLRKTDA